MGGPFLGSVGCLVASLGSAHERPVAPPPSPVQQSKIAPDVVTRALEGKSPE